MDIKNKRQIDIGCQVKIKTPKGEKIYTLVNNLDQSADGKITKLSPIGQAIIGKCIGDKVKVNINSNLIEYKILDIRG